VSRKKLRDQINDNLKKQFGGFMRIKYRQLLLCAAALTCVSAVNAASGSAFTDELQRSKTTDQGKLHKSLRGLDQGHASRSALADRNRAVGSDGMVAINVVAVDGNAAGLKSELEAVGLSKAVSAGGMVSGRAPPSALASIAANRKVQAVRPVLARTHAGLTTTQGDRAQHSDRARQRFHVDGSHVKVGLLSDSFNCLTGPIIPGQNFTTSADDIANGDLPHDTTVLEDVTGSDCIADAAADEGRAMAQIVHDVAPGASIAFHTAYLSEPDFAQGIIDLANAGSNIIADDVYYFDEPMFQDGIVAQAVDAVKARGVAYFSSAGNEARQSYEARWRRSSSFGLSGQRHSFSPSGKKDGLQQITLTDQADEYVILNWDQPFASTGGKGSASDVDLIFYDTDGNPLPDCGTVDQSQPFVCQFAGITNNLGGDALEIAEVANFSGADVQVNVSIELYTGPTPGYLKYVYLDNGNGTMSIDEYDTQSGTDFGHSNAAGAESVGAAAWYNTSAWGVPFHPTCAPACSEYFSSAGGVPILFDTKGNRLQHPQVRVKPGITAPDGGNTSFFYSLFTFAVPGSTEPDQFPNFFGTSAAAPHAAAVAALMMDAARHSEGRGTLSPDRIYKVLRETAIDIGASAGRGIGPFPFAHPKGFDFDSGFGLIDAAAAVGAVSGGD
jgi:hypothetical protein